jgi:predicted nuclease of predicted toxin-antitoxin system
VRILFDECLPRKLASALKGRQTETVGGKGWSGKKNGELLQLMINDGIDVFITSDRSVQYQQHLAQSPLGVIVLAGVSNRYVDLLPLMVSVERELAFIRPGKVIVISA